MARKTDITSSTPEREFQGVRLMLTFLQWFVARRKQLLARSSLDKAGQRAVLEQRFVGFAKKAHRLLGFELRDCPDEAFQTLSEDEQRVVDACCSYFDQLSLDCDACGDSSLARLLRKLARLSKQAPIHIWEAENHEFPTNVTPYEKAQTIEASLRRHDEPASKLIARAVRAVSAWASAVGMGETDTATEWLHRDAIWTVARLQPHSDLSNEEATRNFTRTVAGELGLPKTSDQPRIDRALRERVADGRCVPDAFAINVAASARGVGAKTIKRARQDELRGMALAKPKKSRMARGRPTRVRVAAAATREKAELLAAFHASPASRVVVDDTEPQRPAPRRTRRRKKSP